MIVVLFLAFVISFFLIILLRGQAPNLPFQNLQGSKMHRLGELPDHSSNLPTASATMALPRNFSGVKLEAFCRKLIQKMELKFRSIEWNGERNFFMLASEERPILRGEIILCGHLVDESGVVGPTEIIGFSDMVKAEKAMKGVFLTNGYFSEEVMKLNEGAAIELIDGRELSRLVQEVMPELLS